MNDRKVPKNAVAPGSYEAIVEVNQDNDYAFFSTTGDPWYNRRLLGFANNPISHDFTFEVDAVQPGPGSLRFHGYGVTDWPGADPDHKLMVLLNGEELMSEPLVFNGLHDVNLELDVADGVLQEGSNTLTVYQPADLPGVGFDMVDIDTFGTTYKRGYVYPATGQYGFSAQAKVFEIDEVGAASADQLVVYRMVGANGQRPVYQSKVALNDGKLRIRGNANQMLRYHVSTLDRLLTPKIELTQEPADIMNGQASYVVITTADFIEALQPLVTHREGLGWTVKVVDVADIFSHLSYGIFDAKAVADYIAQAQETWVPRHS